MFGKDRPVELHYEKGLHSPELRKFIWEWIRLKQAQFNSPKDSVSYGTYEVYYRQQIAEELRVHRLKAEGKNEEDIVAFKKRIDLAREARPKCKGRGVLERCPAT